MSAKLHLVPIRDSLIKTYNLYRFVDLEMPLFIAAISDEAANDLIVHGLAEKRDCPPLKNRLDELQDNINAIQKKVDEIRKGGI